jgi:hypothetical protein
VMVDDYESHIRRYIDILRRVLIQNDQSLVSAIIV